MEGCCSLFHGDQTLPPEPGGSHLQSHVPRQGAWIAASPSAPRHGSDRRECHRPPLVRSLVLRLRCAHDATMSRQHGTEAAGRRHDTLLGAAIVRAQVCELIGESAVAMAGRVRAGRVGDTPHPSPTLSELLRWIADQVGQGCRSRPRPGEEQQMSTPVRDLSHHADEACDACIGRVRVRLVEHHVDAITAPMCLRELVEAGSSMLREEQAMAMA